MENEHGIDEAHEAMMADEPERFRKEKALEKRSIKFRAWNKISKVMGMVGSLDNIDYPDGHKHKYVCTNAGVWDWMKIDLMQFTGLKDKNGKEIYEGDIVKAKHCVKPYGGEVYFDNDLARFAIKDKAVCEPLNFIGTPLGKENIYEVIGNIHENKNLIET